MSANQNDKWKQSWQQQLANQMHQVSLEQETSPIPLYFSQPPRNQCPLHSGQHFQNGHGPMSSANSFFDEKPDFMGSGHVSSNSNSYPTPLELARIQLENLIRQGFYNNALGPYDGIMSPPATCSSSQSTHLGRSSAPPFSTHCSSPVPSEVSDYRPRGLFETNFQFSARPEQRDSVPATGYDGRMTSTMYTAEDVHTVVKNRRDGNEQRVLSNKVFVGGISHSTNRQSINSFFGNFGTVFVDWPVKQKKDHRGQPAGLASYSYLFLVYSEEQSVMKLMNACKMIGDEYFVEVPGCREMMQIRPWFIKNAFYIAEKAMNTKCIDVHRTVFVGGLPRIVTAENLAEIFSEFGKVLLVTIDIDQDYAYPKGAARVSFERDTAFNRALERKFLKFRNIDSSKTLIEIKPYVVEDVGCDQCGGLWFNPFLEIYDQLKSSKEENEKRNLEKAQQKAASNDPEHEDLLSKMDACHQKFEKLNAPQPPPPSPPAPDYLDYPTDNIENEVRAGARKFLDMAKSFGLDNQQSMNVNGVEYAIGPDLWNQFLTPPPTYREENESVQMSTEQKVESFLRMKRGNVYSNKSSYCKERPCRQYYCPSCSNKLHSGPDQHVLLPAGKPERRPRKDKDMYLVTPNN